MTDKMIKVILFLVCFMQCCHCFDFTLELHDPDSSSGSQTRHVCGILRCTEALTDQGQSGNQSNMSRQLTSLSVYKTRLGGDGTRGRWRQLASVTPRRSDVSRVSDGVKISGQLSDHQATLSLELVKIHDCQQSQFSCVVIAVDNQDQSSVKKSLVGRAVNAQTDFDPQFQATKVSVPVRKFMATDDHFGSDEPFARLVSLFQAKFDRMDDSFKSLENRLEDKVSALDSTMEATFRDLDLRINSLENRLEDKFVHLDTHVAAAFSQTKRHESDNEGICGQLASKFDDMVAKQEDNRKQLDTCVAEINKVSKNDNVKANISDQLFSAIKSMQLIETNLTSFNNQLDSLETAVDQCTLATNEKHNRANVFESNMTNLSELTRGLASSVNTFRKAYGSGALVSVNEFFDPLNTGKREWRLVFRGTPYINIQVYPAYIHGTGIPIEVEEGCKQFNRSLPCANHYRNRVAFDNWTGIDEIMFAVYKGDQMVQRVIFNGKSSSLTSWFTEGRVIDSSWDDLTTKSHNFFSLTKHSNRKFFINHDYNKSCDGFRGWFMATDSNHGCAVENTVSYPNFFYAIGKTFAVWTSSNAGRADAIGIFLKYE